MSAVRNDHLGLFTGRYAFHLHTTATDGRLEVSDYVHFAREEQLDRLVFLEHIRKEPTYDVDRFIETVASEAEAGGVHAHVGFEAKLLPGGGLDISDADLDRAEVIGIAEHSFPDNTPLLWSSLAAAFRRYAPLAGEKNLVWVHPGLFFQKRGRLEEVFPTYQQYIDLAWSLRIAVEQNLRYQLVPEGLTDDPAAFVVGLDAHRDTDLARMPRIT